MPLKSSVSPAENRLRIAHTNSLLGLESLKDLRVVLTIEKDKGWYEGDDWNHDVLDQSRQLEYGKMLSAMKVTCPLIGPVKWIFDI